MIFGQIINFMVKSNFMSTKGYQFSFSDYFSFKDEDEKKTKQTSIAKNFVLIHL